MIKIQKLGVLFLTPILAVTFSSCEQSFGVSGVQENNPAPGTDSDYAQNPTDISVANVNHASCEDSSYVNSLNNTSDPLFFPEQCMKLLCHFGWKNFDTRPDNNYSVAGSTRGQFVDLESQNGTQWSEMQANGKMGTTLLIYQGWHQQYLYDNFGAAGVNPPLILANSSTLSAKSLASGENYVDVYNTHGTELEDRYSDDEFLFRVFFTRNSDGELVDDGIQIRGDNFKTQGCVKMAHIPSE